MNTDTNMQYIAHFYIYWPKLSQCGLLSYNTPSKDNGKPDKHITAGLSKGATYRCDSELHEEPRQPQHGFCDSDSGKLKSR